MLMSDLVICPGFVIVSIIFFSFTLEGVYCKFTLWPGLVDNQLPENLHDQPKTQTIHADCRLHTADRADWVLFFLFLFLHLLLTCIWSGHKLVFNYTASECLYPQAARARDCFNNVTNNGDGAIIQFVLIKWCGVYSNHIFGDTGAVRKSLSRREKNSGE